MDFITILKIIALFGILIFSFLFAILPVKWERFRKAPIALSVANAFSGGLFITAGQDHIMPGSANKLRIFEAGKLTFPWPYFAAVFAFSLILFIDKILWSHSHSHGDESETNSHHDLELGTSNDANAQDQQSDFDLEKENGFQKHALAANEDFVSAYKKQLNSNSISRKVGTNPNDDEDTAPELPELPLKKHMSAPAQSPMGTGTSPQFRIHDHDHKAVVMETIREEYTPLDRSKVLADCVGSSIRGESCRHDEITPKLNINLPLAKKTSDLSEPLIQEKLTDGHTHGHEDKHPVNIGPYLVAMAMGVHAAFAGLALGLQTTFTGFLGMLFAIVGHKWAESIAVGIGFAKEIQKAKLAGTQSVAAEKKTLRTVMGVLVIFSQATPIGIAVGIALSGVNLMVNSILMAMSAGTFIYIASVEIVVEEFNQRKNLGLKSAAFIFGCLVMVSVFFMEKAVVK